MHKTYNLKKIIFPCLLLVSKSALLEQHLYLLIYLVIKQTQLCIIVLLKISQC